jgi:hypothetical protein
MFYEISFFVYLIYVFISKWIKDPVVRKMALVVLGIAVLYQLLYILILRKKDYITFGRCVAIGFFYISLIIFIMYVIYSMSAFFHGANITGFFSLGGFFRFYSLPVVSHSEFAGMIVNLVCLIYMFVYIIVTRRKYIKSPY